MNTHEEGPPDEEATTAANSLAGILLLGQMEAEAEAKGIATDTATLNSDAAVGGSVGGGSGEKNRSTSTSNNNGSGGGGSITPPEAAPPEATNKSNSNARQRHYRKRALSVANSSGTVETSNSMTAAQARQNSDIANANGSGSASDIINRTLNHQSTIGTIGSNNMSGAEHSIVSFGLNFNFDSTSSPSNSDSGEGAVNGGNGGEGSSEDDNNGNTNDNNKNSSKNKAPANIIGVTDMKKHKHHHHKSAKNTGTSNSSSENKVGGGNKNNTSGSNEGKNSKGSSSKNSKNKGDKKAKVKFDNGIPSGKTTTGEEQGSGGSSTSSSESSMNENDMNNDSGGSASSNSGNDGSSGGKSTISTLTTSSNQEWMATNDAAASAAKQAGVVGDATPSGQNETAAENNVTSDEKDQANINKDAKKRKMAEKGDEGGNEDDDGYKTDEEQWGGNRNADGTDKCANGPLPGGPSGTHNKGLLSLLKASSSSSKKSNGSNEGPPMKQARFSIDHEHPQHHEHPTQCIRSVDASAQALSSLSGSDSAGVPAVTASSGGQTGQGLSSSSGAGTSNPTSSSPQNAKPTSNKRKASTQNATSTSTDPNKRKERNAREKERSCRIAKQIDDLRTLLSRGGVIVSKGTKSSVLAEAANYINALQQQQAQWEMEKQTLLQQMQQVALPNAAVMGQQPGKPTNIDMSMGSGVLLPNTMLEQAGIVPQQMPLGVQPGLPGQGGTLPVNPLVPVPPQQAALAPAALTNGATNQNDYQFIFNNSSVGMAIASLGGAFVDCNSIFCQLSEFTKEEICAMTIFNMTSRQDLQHAFDLISQMITPALGGADNAASEKGEDKASIVLRGAMKNRTDLGLSISLIKGENGIAKCFCVTLVKILSMETTRPDTVSIQMELPQVWSTKQQKNVGFAGAPAYTAG